MNYKDFSYTSERKTNNITKLTTQLIVVDTIGRSEFLSVTKRNIENCLLQVSWQNMQYGEIGSNHKI